MIELNMKKFVMVIILLLLLWGSFFFFAVRYGKKLTVHPCNVCAERIGEEVVCSTTGSTKTFFPNGNTETKIHYDGG